MEKDICAELVNSGGAAGEWLITDEFSTDLDEMGIFVLSKDQTFRICATFLDPAKIFHFSHTFSVSKIYFCELSCIRYYFSQIVNASGSYITLLKSVVD